MPEPDDASRRSTAVRDALIVDWGGVLTTPVREAIAEWIRLERIDADHYRTLARAWISGAYSVTDADGMTSDGATPRRAVYDEVAADSAAALADAGAGGSGVGADLIHRLEEGTLAPAEFERVLAARLRTVDGAEIAATGLLARMFAGFRPVDDMYEMLRRARAAGIRTCLLSNSWGNAYPRESFAGLFDAVVISAEVGMRKPHPEIFHHALDLVAAEPAAAVFVDDTAANVHAAEALGIAGVHHQQVPATVRRLEELLGVSLA